ncbi:MAG: YraN family protein [Planctomycetota bacterium]
MSRLRDRVDDWRFGTIDESAALGRRGEQAAARLLRQRGLKVIVESESDRRGEIDLIAMGRGSRLMVFVEVKTLASLRPGHPADRVDEAKQRRITRAALRYLRRQRLIGVPCRFDVVAVWWPRHERRPTKIEHYEAAFEAQGVDSFFT